MPKSKKIEKIEEKKPEEQKTEGKPPAIELAKMSRAPQLVKGMKDIVPADQVYWEYIRLLIKKLSTDYGFERIDVPTVEELALYTHSVGKQTDIVEKEMYAFADQGGNMIALRPEFTAGIVRAFVEHGMANVPQPVKVYALGPVFRYDKPQEGRYRQHHQFDCEILGEAKPAADAQLIVLAHKFFVSLGIMPILHINSIGCLTCRATYKEALSEYYHAKRSHVCEDCKRRMSRNILRLLDCKMETCLPLKSKAPHIVDFLCDDCQGHFMGVLELIDEFDIPYRPNPHLVRGLDYYTRTVFEFFAAPASGEGEETKDDAKLVALGGGGRYDNLAEVIGGPATPGCGFAIGIERVVLKIKEQEGKGVPLPFLKKREVEVFVAQLGEQAKRKAMLLYESLLHEGFALAESFTKDSLKAQLEVANRIGTKFTLILGEKERTDGTIIIRNMEGGEQEVIDIKKLVPILHKKLAESREESKEEKEEKK